MVDRNKRIKISLIILGIVLSIGLIYLAFFNDKKSEQNNRSKPEKKFNEREFLNALRLFKKYKNCFNFDELKENDSYFEIFDMLDKPDEKIENFKSAIDRILKYVEIDVSKVNDLVVYLYLTLFSLTVRNYSISDKYEEKRDFVLKNSFFKKLCLLTEINNKLVVKWSLHDSVFSRKIVLEDIINKEERIFIIPEVLFIRISEKQTKKFNINFDKEQIIEITYQKQTLKYKVTGALITKNNKVYSLVDDNGNFEVYDACKKISMDNKIPILLRIEKV